MQYCYVSLSGDRFPFGYFATKTASAIVHASRFYEAVRFLVEGGFRIFFGLFDGASPNRSFYQSQLHGKMADLFVTMIKATRDTLFLIMDPSVRI